MFSYIKTVKPKKSRQSPAYPSLRFKKQIWEEVLKSSLLSEDLMESLPSDAKKISNSEDV